MAAPPDSTLPTPLARLFVSQLEAGVALAFGLPGGAPLFRAGEPADAVFWLKTGRLAVRRSDPLGETSELGVIRPGEPAGEMAVIAGEPHSATVTALRNCEMLALPRAALLEAMEGDAAVAAQLARMLAVRSRPRLANRPAGEPSVFAFVGVDRDVDVRALAETIAGEVRRQGSTAIVVGKESCQEPPDWYARVEAAHDFVLYAAEHDQDAWKVVVGHQADRLFWIGRGEASPPEMSDSHIGSGLRAEDLIDLILLQPPGRATPSGSAAWRRVFAPARLFQLRPSSATDMARMARVITGRAVGLVLSGGAARAYAHIGAVRVLRARGVPIDVVCGSSMGAVVAAGLALEWGDDELDRRIRKAFVESSPVGDIAFPLIALSGGKRVRARLEEHFGDREISDFWLPFFCLSTNLTRGAPHVHRHGLVREALRASLALPGVLPPVVRDGNVFVDGAILNNFPADILRKTQPGPIVGVDVGRARSFDAGDLMDPASFWRWLSSGAWRRGPPIVSLLFRAATVTNGREVAAAREATDFLIQPEVDAIEIRDWKAYAPAVAAGETATLAVLGDIGGAAGVLGAGARPAASERAEEPRSR